MKEFNLEAAKAGAEVCTRDGRPVEILRACDIKEMDAQMSIMTVINQKVVFYYPDGTLAFRHHYPSPMPINEFNGWHLMMADEKFFVPFNYRPDDVISREGISTSASTIEINE